MDMVLRCTHVGKKFCKSLKKSMLYGAQDILQSMTGCVPDASRLRPDEFWAVDQVSFELKRGDTLGIIGPNGSGKTTLLRMLNGIFLPDKGTIEIQGRVGGLIQVGAGFHPLLSGWENIYINGTILGMSKKEIDRKFDSIVAFADIGDFLNAPIKHYSSGMLIRLGFAIAVHCELDVILIDEILSVGDIKFQAKCAKFLTEHLLKSGCTVIFVSHNRYAVQDLCQRVLYLNHGQMAGLGETRLIMDRYLKDMQETKDNRAAASQPARSPAGHKGVITKVLFMDKEGRIRSQFTSGETVCIRMYYMFEQKAQRPSAGITFVHADERYSVVSSTDYLLNLHSGYDGLNVSDLEGQGYFEVVLNHLYLPVGMYKFMTYLFTDNNINLIQKNEDAGDIEILWSAESAKRSLMDLPHVWTMHRLTASV